MNINPYNVTRFVSQQQRFNREVNSTIERLNAGVTVRPKDDPAAFAAYQQTQVYENQLKTAGVNAERAQAFGQETLNQLDQATAIVDELRELYLSEGDDSGTQVRIDELLVELDEINADAEFAGRPLFAVTPGSQSTTSTGSPTIPTIGGVQLGFADGDLTFQANQWNGSFNAGEFLVTGTQFTRTQDPGAAPVSLGDIDRGVTARDDATGTGYILHSEESVYSRFADEPYPNSSTNLVAVVYDQGQWYYDDNFELRAFTPQATDTLIAEVDFTNDTISALSLPEEAPAESQPAAANTFRFATSPEFALASSELSLNSIGASQMGTDDYSLSDLGTGGALDYANGDRSVAIQALDAALSSLDDQRQNTKTFVKTTVGSLEAVNQQALSAATTRRTQLESQAGAEANAEAIRLTLLSASQTLLADAAQTQADTLISLLEQATGRTAPRAISSASFFHAGIEEQQQNLADAMESYRQAASESTPQEFDLEQAAASLREETLGLDLTG